MSKTFILIDGHALIYRAYHAFQDLSTPSGVKVNAVYGFARILLTVIRDFHPEYIAVTFDTHAPTFRHAEYLGYKSSRPEMPEDLRPQIDIIKKVVTAFNIPQFELPGYEADDLIGTLSAQARDLKQNLLTVIVTGDRDAFQLVEDDLVHVWLPGRGKFSKDKEYNEEGVMEKMGVKPSQIIDLKALMGDASDCIPGVKGIGEKTAVKLIQEFGSVDSVYENLVQPEKLTESQKKTLTPAIVKKLAEGQQDAVMSKQLATIDRNSPITLELELCRMSTYKKDDVVVLFEELQFTSLLKLLPADEFELDVQAALF
jgi:DNA polymerase I